MYCSSITWVKNKECSPLDKPDGSLSTDHEIQSYIYLYSPKVSSFADWTSGSGCKSSFSFTETENWK